MNGRLVKCLLWENACDLTAYVTEGENTLGLEIVTGNKNLFGPHHLEQTDLLYVSPDSFQPGGGYQKDYTFENFGIQKILLEYRQILAK